MDDLIDLKQLAFVLLVAEELHIRKAAERLKVDESTVSRGVRQFEKEQELTVFVRAGKRIADLTPEGERFIEHIKPAFHAFQTEAARASEIAEMIVRKSAGTFMLGYSPLVSAAMLSEVRFVRTARFPALRLQIRQLKPSEIFNFVRSSALQMGLTYAFPQRDGLEQIPIGGEPMCAVYPRRTGTRAGVGIDLEQLRSQPLYVLSSDREHADVRECLVLQCARRGFTPKIVEEPVSAREVFDLVLDRGGVAIMPECMYVGAPAELDSSLIAGLESIQLVLTYRRGADTRTEKIVREIARSLRNLRAKRAG
jgi:DNA-binding transcriptional LysR family regulator